MEVGQRETQSGRDTQEETSTTVRHRIFESSTEPWEELCSEASAFAMSLGPERLINISAVGREGSEAFALAGKVSIVVWYWE